MNFLYPQFLWALFAVLVPIIIHLFNFKKFKKIYFSDLKLLKEVEMETSKKSNLKHLLILLARILAISALVFAFAQPYFTSDTIENTQGEKVVSVYVDNSFSMNNVAQEFSLLDKAKEQAEAIANQFEQSDKFLLVTNDFEPKHQKCVTQNEFIELVRDIESSSKTRKLSQIDQKQQDFLQKEGGNKLSYFISDFQKSTSNLPSLRNDSSLDTKFVHLSPEIIGNVYIDSVWFETPVRTVNRKEILKAKLINSTEEDIQVKIDLWLNGKIEGFVNQDVVANSSAEVALNYQVANTGVVEGKLKISEYPNPVSTFDDEFYFSYLLKDSAQIIVINKNSKYLDNKSGNINQLFKNDTYFYVQNQSVSSIDYSKFNQANLIIINQLNEFASGLVSQLLAYMETGGSVVVFPGAETKLNSINELLLGMNAGRFDRLDTVSTKVTYLNFEHPVFVDVFSKIPKNIDLPKVSNSYKFSLSPHARVEKLMRLQSGNQFLSKFSVGNGNGYVFTVPLSKEFSNLTSHSVFVTTLLRIAESSGVSQATNQWITENSVSIKDQNRELGTVHITNLQKEIDVIPEIQSTRGELKLFIPESVNVAGNYKIVTDDKNLGAFGFNYDRKESDFNSFTVSELKDVVGEGKVIDASQLNLSQKGAESLVETETKWWKLFIMLALLFIAIEIALIKWMQ